MISKREQQATSAVPGVVLRALVVDDDPVSRALMARYVDQHDALMLAGVCDSAIASVPLLREGAVDVLFLDVEMPEMTGLELVRALDACPHVVLVTGKQHYAVEAFDVSVTDYLLKPVQYARFLQAVERVLQARSATHVLPPAPPAALERASDSLFARVDGRLVRIDTRDVHHVEARGDYVLVHTPKKHYLVHATMKQMEARLPGDAFVRVHRSHIVRLDRIVDLEEATLVVERDVVPIGASHREGLLARLNPL